MKITIEFHMIQINLDSRFHLQLTSLIFGTKSQKKYTSGRKQKKKNITIELFIFELVYLSTNSQLKLTSAIFRQNLPKKRVAIFSLKEIK